MRGALTVDDIVTVDLAGNLVEGSARPPLEFHIHSEVYRARPDVNAVMHTHPQWSTFLTMVGEKFKPVYAQGVLLGDIPLMDSPLSVNTKPMGEKLAAHARPRSRGPAQGAWRRHRGRRHRRMLCARRVCRGERLSPVHGDADWRAVRLQRSGAAGLREKLWSPSLFKKTWDHYRSKLPISHEEHKDGLNHKGHKGHEGEDPKKTKSVVDVWILGVLTFVFLVFFVV